MYAVHIPSACYQMARSRGGRPVLAIKMRESAAERRWGDTHLLSCLPVTCRYLFWRCAGASRRGAEHGKTDKRPGATVLAKFKFVIYSPSRNNSKTRDTPRSSMAHSMFSSCNSHSICHTKCSCVALSQEFEYRGKYSLFPCSLLSRSVSPYAAVSDTRCRFQ